MDKVTLFFALVFWIVAGCNPKPDHTAEIKTIDSLQTEIKKTMEECNKLDTSWINDVTVKADNMMLDIKRYYAPDSIIQEEVKIISYYKGYRKIGKRFREGRRKLINEMELSLKQLNDLKADAESGALKKEELVKYIGEEKIVTTDLIFQFNDMKYSTTEVLKNFDSLTPMIQKIIDVYREKNPEKASSEEKPKSGRTIY
jgi:hypothetical protein